MQLWQFRRKIHTSWLIAICSVAIVIGTACVPLIEQSFFGAPVWLVVGLAALAVVFWRRSVYLLPAVVIAGLLVGLWRGSLLESQLVVYENMMNHTVTLSGKVTDDPDAGQRDETLLRLGNISVDGHMVSGKVWVSAEKAGDIKRGDRVTVQGAVSEGFGSFAAAIYEAQMVRWQRPQPGDVARQVRDWFADKVRLGISEPQSSLGLGYLLGQRRALPAELQQALVVTGLTHVVVASGYNLTILVRLARRLFEKVSKYLSALSAGAMIVAFMAITGASPSMSRAGLVSGLSLAAWYYGRKFHPLVILPFAAAITVLIDPTYAWNDLGWQLSFAAFGGVMILAPLLQRYFFGDKEPGTVRQILGETISAQIATLPIIILAFGQFSTVALFSNLLILPLVPLAMLLTFVTGLGAIVIPGAAPIVGVPAEWLLTYMTSVVHYFAGLPWAQMIIQIQPWQAALAYGLIVSVCLYLWRATKFNLRNSNIVV